MKTRLFKCLLLTLLLIGSYTNNAKAETALFFAPNRLDIQEEKPVQEIRVTNMSDIARSYKLSIQNFIMNANGQTARVENFDYSAKRMIRFVPRQFDIPPGGKQIIRVMARFPNGTEDGDYHAHLEFLEDLPKRKILNKDLAPENQAKMNAQIAYTMAIPIIISKGEVNTEVSIKDATFETDKKGTPFINMNIARSGNGQGNSYVEADYLTPDGRAEKATVRRTVYTYREIDERPYKFQLELLDQNDIKKGGKIKVKLYNKSVSETEPVDTTTIDIP